MFYLNRFLHDNNFRTMPSMLDLFKTVNANQIIRNNSAHTNTNAYDHVLIDISSSCMGAASRASRYLVGNDRDNRAVEVVERTLNSHVLAFNNSKSAAAAATTATMTTATATAAASGSAAHNNVGIKPRKTLSLFMDGSLPLWRLQQLRLHPPRRYDAVFYPSAASTAPYAVERAVVRSIMEEIDKQNLLNNNRTKNKSIVPSEVVYSGPGTSGVAAGKMVAFLNDLGTRREERATLTADTSAANEHLCEVGDEDSVCIVGGHETLLLNAIAALPLFYRCCASENTHNNFSATLMSPLGRGDVKVTTLKEVWNWLLLDDMLAGAAEPVQREAALRGVRCDVLLLYLLCHGFAPLELTTNGHNFNLASLLEVYSREVKEKAIPQHTFEGSDRNRLSSVFFREVDGDNGTDAAGGGSKTALLSLKVEPFLRVLLSSLAEDPNSSAPRIRGLGSLPARKSHVIANYMEVLLQSCELLVKGRLTNGFYLPGGIAKPDLSSKIVLEDFVAHLKHLASQGGGGGGTASEVHASTTSTVGGGDGTEIAALTGVESLLLSCLKKEEVREILGLFCNGHFPPSDEVIFDILEDKNMRSAVEKTRRFLSGLYTNSGHSNCSENKEFFHPAVRHMPSHFFLRNNNSKMNPESKKGEMKSYDYFSICLGEKYNALH